MVDSYLIYRSLSLDFFIIILMIGMRFSCKANASNQYTSSRSDLIVWLRYVCCHVCMYVWGMYLTRVYLSTATPCPLLTTSSLKNILQISWRIKYFSSRALHQSQLRTVPHYSCQNNYTHTVLGSNCYSAPARMYQTHTTHHPDVRTQGSSSPMGQYAGWSRSGYIWFPERALSSCTRPPETSGFAACVKIQDVGPR